MPWATAFAVGPPVARPRLARRQAPRRRRCHHPHGGRGGRPSRTRAPSRPSASGAARKKAPGYCPSASGSSLPPLRRRWRLGGRPVEMAPRRRAAAGRQRPSPSAVDQGRCAAPRRGWRRQPPRLRSPGRPSGGGGRGRVVMGRGVPRWAGAAARVAASWADVHPSGSPTMEARACVSLRSTPVPRPPPPRNNGRAPVRRCALTSTPRRTASPLSRWWR